MKVLLLMVIMTNGNYNRGYGDGIAASKSASAAIQTAQFINMEQCQKVKAVFDTKVVPLKSEKGQERSNIFSECIEYHL